MQLTKIIEFIRSLYLLRIAVYLRKMEFLNKTNNNTDIFLNSKEYNISKFALHPCIISNNYTQEEEDNSFASYFNNMPKYVILLLLLFLFLMNIMCYFFLIIYIRLKKNRCNVNYEIRIRNKIGRNSRISSEEFSNICEKASDNIISSCTNNILSGATRTDDKHNDSGYYTSYEKIDLLDQ